MSVQFGRCNLDGKPAYAEQISSARSALLPYGPDSGTLILKDNMGVLYCAFHTTRVAQRKERPHLSEQGTLVTWDGMLHNRVDLISQLAGQVSAESLDEEIVAASFECWGADCFAKLIGDWAVSIGADKGRKLFLAKDVIGTRPLYYTTSNSEVIWSSTLEPILLLTDRSLRFDEEYIAGWLSFFPATHLTPYIGIHSVPPGSFLCFQAGVMSERKYWNFASVKSIAYRRDSEYEEHFRSVFAESVRRRLRADRPLLAELSGGMDSSAIVCMADVIMASGWAESPRLDTVSYYDDSEPNWNERPYFMKVEQQRGREGCHINVGAEMPQFLLKESRFSSLPGGGSCNVNAARALSSHIASGGYRVILSGLGGDEVTGSVPTPSPEIADLLVEGQVTALCHQLKLWALYKRRPWFYLLAEAAREFLPGHWADPSASEHSPFWLYAAFIKRNQGALTGYPRKLQLIGPRPSLQQNVAALELLRRQINCSPLASGPHYEKRYPYLDRSLLEFLYAVPREQLLRPGQRRSLMRRSLAGIVPKEILERRRKAFVIRQPMAALASQFEQLRNDATHMVTSSLGIVDSAKFVIALDKVRLGHEINVVALLRTLAIERWLRQILAANEGHISTFSKGPFWPQRIASDQAAKRERAVLFAPVTV
jgi:asparagine synthase (glutamine-hydrolysing)